MHQPRLQKHRRRIGPNGDFRFRQQRFTGRQILQVAIVFEVVSYFYPWERDDPNTPFVSEVEWEDAKPREAMMLSMGAPPFSRREVKMPTASQMKKDLEEWRKEHGLSEGYRHLKKGECKHVWFMSASAGPGLGEGEYCSRCGMKRPLRMS